MEEESFMSMISISDNLWNDEMIDISSISFTRMADIIQQQVITFNSPQNAFEIPNVTTLLSFKHLFL